MTFKTWVDGIVGGANSFVIPLLFACAFIAFLWGIVKYFFLKNESEEGRREAKQFLLWGLLGMVLLFSIWGVVNILLATLGFA